mgnify:CR=1 FL=1
MKLTTKQLRRMIIEEALVSINSDYNNLLFRIEKKAKELFLKWIIGVEPNYIERHIPNYTMKFDYMSDRWSKIARMMDRDADIESLVGSPQWEVFINMLIRMKKFAVSVIKGEVDEKVAIFAKQDTGSFKQAYDFSGI